MSADVVREGVYSSALNSTQSTQPAASPLPYISQQYALPIHHNATHGGNHDPLREVADPNVRLEHSLRRKTPNGTLKAGYFSSTSDANPQKHILLPLSEGNASLPVPVAVPGAKRTYLQHQQQRAHSATSSTNWNVISPMGHSGSPFSVPYTSLPADSVLHQLPTYPYNHQQLYAQTVPSVLQPSVQYLGPTAPGIHDSGLYGPYWHDGTFVPYRPAALRDPRFYHPYANANNLPGTPVGPPFLPTTQIWNQKAGASAQWSQSPGVYPWMNPLYSSQSPTSVSPFAPPGMIMQDLQHIPRNTSQSRSDVVTPRPVNEVDRTPDFPQTDINGDFGPPSLNGQNRDQIFAWALQQYRELLSHIHSTRSQHHQTRQPYGQKSTPSRPAFYPRPPKPSSLGSTAQINQEQQDRDQKTKGAERKPTFSLVGAPTDTLSGDPSVQDELRQDNTDSRTKQQWPAAAPYGQEPVFHRRASHDQYRRPLPSWPFPQQQPTDKYQTLRRASGSSVTSCFPPMPTDSLPTSNAQMALRCIIQHCQTSNWQWVDGMHLGGCLAYGLGHYPKALRFYTLVLEREPKHLEALSNLAATLLALGRRQDAEQNWIKVVKAAPNHFEAVEHLVGMLCTGQRSREAVRVIEHVERSLRLQGSEKTAKAAEEPSSSSSIASKSSSTSEQSDKILYDFEVEGDVRTDWRGSPGANEPGFGSSGFSIPASDNGRILALIHAKGNMLYGLGDNIGAAYAFEEAVLIAIGRHFDSIGGLVKHILSVVTAQMHQSFPKQQLGRSRISDPILLSPEEALLTAKLCFPVNGELPGLQYLPGGPQSIARKAVISTTSNSLLSLAKIFQDSMSSPSRSAGITSLPGGVRDILALYYLSLALQPSPSTANNVGILLASVQQKTPGLSTKQKPEIPGVVPGSGVALALQYYNYGLKLDQQHAHLFTNLGSLLKDIGQLDAAITMYERAVKCDAKFDIALANLANAVKDKGRINDAISYYKRAVAVNPDFAEAVCGLANALNSVCNWTSRGGIADDHGKRDRWHVDSHGMLQDARHPTAKSSGWIKRVIEIVEKQLTDGESWGVGTLSPTVTDELVNQLIDAKKSDSVQSADWETTTRQNLESWAGKKWEGARVVRLIERATKRIGWLWYRDVYIRGQNQADSNYARPRLPASLSTPSAPTVLPFHTFTCPMSAKQIRLISQRNGLRISVATLRAPWLPKQVFRPPAPPAPFLRIGYVSSDFNNHPLAHLMQSVFGLHDGNRARAYCYATTASDNSSHRRQIESEAPVFHDASGWSTEKLVNKIVDDGIHILVNLNGYTRGARNEVFAARPAPIQMSFMGFAGTLGAEWCDYLLADETAIPSDTLRPYRSNVHLADQMVDETHYSDDDNWVYGENIIYCRDTFFCCDHRQSAPDANNPRLSWEEEQDRRWKMRKELFPDLADDIIIFGNFNQLYKIEPTTYRSWLRILCRVPNSILWLLRFPDMGETHLIATARLWAGDEVASRVRFTDVAPKHQHISRARVCDLVLDTAECNAHTTAADVLWSGTPLLTLPRYPYKMCSRMAASILKGALPRHDAAVAGAAASDLVALSEDDYEEKAVKLGTTFSYPPGSRGHGRGRLMDLRRILYEARWSSALFDTKRWVRDLEDAYDEAWRRWVAGEGGDIWLDKIPRK